MTELPKSKEEYRGPKARRLVDDLLEISDTINVEMADIMPKRCRAIIINSLGDSILVVKRKRPGMDDYAVLPGGGVEEYDETPLGSIKRELAEELSIDSSSVSLTEDKVIKYEDQWVYVGIAKDGLSEFEISGPEKDRDPITSGTYEPTWIKIDDMTKENVVPAHLRLGLENAYNIHQ